MIIREKMSQKIRNMDKDQLNNLLYYIKGYHGISNELMLEHIKNNEV